MNDEISKDLERAKEALKSAERNFKEDDILTAANRIFVACENSAWIVLKIKFGSTSISRMKILTKLKEINPALKEVYDKSYDLRVQADYGRASKFISLTKENLEKIIKDVKAQLAKAENLIKTKNGTKI